MYFSCACVLSFTPFNFVKNFDFISKIWKYLAKRSANEKDRQDKLTAGAVDGIDRCNLNAGNLFSSPKGLFDTNHAMELIDEPTG